MKFLVIIPARYQSSRFPGKPLAQICGKEMIIRVCEQVSKAGVEAVVATDDFRIYDCVVNSGYKAVMTSPDHRSGTERVAEAYRLGGEEADIVINVQGDEPFIQPAQILKIIEIFKENPETEIATLAKKFDLSAGPKSVEDPNVVKVVFTEGKDALYFSRSVIPYVRSSREDWWQATDYYAHIGIYAYRAATLQKVVGLPESSLEKAESLEQLRWLQNGIGIKVGVTEFSTIGIDTPEDLAKAEQILSDEKTCC